MLMDQLVGAGVNIERAIRGKVPDDCIIQAEAMAEAFAVDEITKGEDLEMWAGPGLWRRPVISGPGTGGKMGRVRMWSSRPELGSLDGREKG